MLLKCRSEKPINFEHRCVSFPVRLFIFWEASNGMLHAHSGSSQYAVAVNKRGLEDKEKPGVTTASVFGKPECIHAVAEAIQSLTEYISVDLTNPQVVSKSF